METLVISKTEFTFTQFTNYVISEIWMNNEHGEQYSGEYVLYMN